MSEILESIKDYATELDIRVRQLEACAGGMKGGVSVIRKNGHAFFIVRTTEKGKCTSRYIPPGNEKLIESYVKARYAKKLLPVLRSDLKAANAFVALHSGKEEDDAVKEIDPAILAFCSDLYVPKRVMAEEWMQSKGPETPLSGSDPGVKTARGDFVRSKSEALIANALFARELVYLYEKPLYLDTKRYAFFPDFTILRLSDMKEIYWEHFGMMDDSDYLNSALKKISDYISNGIIPGRDLICTFECSRKPLSSEDVEMLIKAILL